MSDAELISNLIFIEKELVGGKIKFRELADLIEPWSSIRLLKLMPWYFDHDVPLA